MSNYLIETQGLGKRYGDVQAVDNLSLRVAEGEIYAFLGLNGAGKTSTIRMLLGMIRPSSGSATVLQTRVRLGSRDPWDKVGYLVETPHAYQELSVYENLEVARRLHPGAAPAAVDQIIERLGLAAYAGRRAGNLSLGNAQRLGLARALLHGPRLVFLDEPANGLDPVGIIEIRQLLLELTHQQGVTVFMSSHILAEVARLAGRIGIIHQGRLLQELDVDEFALFASIGRGYLLPIGVAILVLIMANVVEIAGWGEFFPWAIPGLYSQPKFLLTAASYWVVMLTGLAGILATYLWWKFADPSR